jgi:polyisoprenoid-binding protein YceI
MRRFIAFPLAAAFLAVALVGFTWTQPVPDDASEMPTSSGEVSTWSVDKSHSNVGFKVRHLAISNVSGRFHEYDVDLRFDPADLSTLETIATVQVASIDTENQKRDDHLRSPDFFAAADHPVMTFESKEVRNIDGNTFELVGDLTIRDVTKEVVLDGELIGTATMRGNEIAALEASTTIDRMDYGLQWNKLTEAGGVMVGHNVEIILEIEAVKQADAPQSD